MAVNKGTIITSLVCSACSVLITVAVTEFTGDKRTLEADSRTSTVTIATLEVQIKNLAASFKEFKEREFKEFKEDTNTKLESYNGTNQKQTTEFVELRTRVNIALKEIGK